MTVGITALRARLSLCAAKSGLRMVFSSKTKRRTATKPILTNRKYNKHNSKQDTNNQNTAHIAARHSPRGGRRAQRRSRRERNA
jgi:hypothetical protein